MFYATNEIRAEVGSRNSYQNEAKHLPCQHLPISSKHKNPREKAPKTYPLMSLMLQGTRPVILKQEIFSLQEGEVRLVGSMRMWRKEDYGFQVVSCFRTPNVF